MGEIATYLNKIRRATYGQEVRGAIADGIEECYRQVTGSEDFVDSVASILEENTTTTVTQGQVGSDAAVDVTREGTNLNFHFTIPQGNTGERGPVGPPPNISVTVHKIDDSEADPTVEVTGSPATPIISLGLPKGPQGDRGPQGAVSGISVDAEGLSPGSEPEVTVSYPTQDTAYPHFHFKIPAGRTGTIANATGETVRMSAANGSKFIKDYVDDLVAFACTVYFSAEGTQSIIDARFTENHYLIGYQFYDSSDTETGRVLANFFWSTSDGALQLNFTKIHIAGSVRLIFGCCQAESND